MLLKPHCGDVGVPFMYTRTGCLAMSAAMKSCTEPSLGFLDTWRGASAHARASAHIASTRAGWKSGCVSSASSDLRRADNKAQSAARPQLLLQQMHAPLVRCASCNRVFAPAALRAPCLARWRSIRSPRRARRALCAKARRGHRMRVPQPASKFSLAARVFGRCRQAAPRPPGRRVPRLRHLAVPFGERVWRVRGSAAAPPGHPAPLLTRPARSARWPWSQNPACQAPLVVRALAAPHEVPERALTPWHARCSCVGPCERKAKSHRFKAQALSWFTASWLRRHSRHAHSQQRPLSLPPG